MIANNQNLKQILQLFDKLQKAKVKGDLVPKDMVKHYITETEGQIEDDALEGDFAADRAFEAFNDLLEKVALVSQEYQKSQVQQKQAPSIISGKQNFDEMKHTMHRIIRLQAWFRKELTLKRLSKQLKQSKAALQQKKGSESPEETALREFSQQLSNKNLTPESFFRICDTDYKQTIQVGNFKDTLLKVGIKLSRGQLSRLILILDEDMEGNITREEYYNALEAYNVSGEKHKSLDGSLYHPFEHRSLFKLIVELKKKDISHLEMFNSCDINDDTRVNINEIQRFVEGLSPDFKQKELHALMNYLDIDKNGLVDKDEFLRQLNKGEQTYRQSQILNKQIAERKSATSSAQKKPRENAFFDEVEIGAGDQSVFGFIDNIFGKKKEESQKNTQVQDKPPSKISQQTKPQQENLDFDASKRKLIIEKMEKEGQNFQSFFTSLKQMTSAGLISLGSLLKSIEVSYPTISAIDRNFVIKECMVDRSKVDYLQLEQLFTKFSKNLKASTSQTFQVISGNIIKRMGGFNALDSIKQFFRAQNISENDVLSDMEFHQLFSGKFCPTLSKSDLDSAFQSLDIDLDGFAQVRDLIEVLASYSSTSDSQSGINIKELGGIIPGFETMSPRTRCEEIIQMLINELNKKNMKPINVYKMADSKNLGSVQAGLLEQTFKKILPQIKVEVISEALNAFRVKTTRDLITRDDFNTVFSEEKKQYIPNSQSINNKSLGQSQSKLGSTTNNQIKPATADIDDQSIKWIRKLDNAMLRERISPGVAFKAADINHNNVVTVDELRESIKRLIPEDSLSLMDLKKIMLAFDKNKNGFIEEEEFIQLIENARNSNVTYMESPQKAGGRSLKEEMNDRRGALPIKNQEINRNDNRDYNSIEMIVEAIEKKVNLKQFFTEIPINEEGQFMVAHVSRRFKSIETLDGSQIKPSDYLPIVKALDPQQKTVIHIKDLLKFLEKNSKAYESDCTLELKYIANFIEFQMRNRNTKRFFLDNSKLNPQQTARLMEVELMSELQRMFGISMQIGRKIFLNLQQVKGSGNDIFLDDLCKVIDQYRLVEVDTQAEIKQSTTAKKLNPQKALLKFVFKMLSVSQKRREDINMRIVEIERAENSIPYRDFFELFVTENQLLDNKESIALFEYLISLGKKPKAVEITVFQNQLQLAQDYVQKCQDKAIGSAIQKAGNGFFGGLTKINMNEYGYISKNNFKQYLLSHGIINKAGTNPQDSEYALNLKTQLTLEDIQLTQYIQADEYVQNSLIDDNENCRIWSIIEFIAKTSSCYEQLAQFILKYFGKLMDLIVPNKATFVGIQGVCPQFLSVQDGSYITQMIEKIQEYTMKKVQGFNQGQLRDHSKLCIDAMFKSLGNLPFKILDDNHPFLKIINQHRALLQKSGQVDEMSQSLNDRETDYTSLVQQLEKQLGMKLEDAVAEIYKQDFIPTLSFNRMILQHNDKINKSLISQISIAIDKRKSTKITKRDFFAFMKQIEGKYDNQNVMQDLLSNIEEPIQKYLEQQGILPSENYTIQEFYDVLSSISNLSQFECYCLFFEIATADDDYILGSQLIQKLKEFKSLIDKKAAKSLDDSREEKKSVRFGDTQTLRDEQAIKALCNTFVQGYAQISQDSIIENGLSKFQKVMNSIKNQADAVSKFDASGKGYISVDQFKSKLDDMKLFSNEEKLAIAFIPINYDKSDIPKINITSFIKVVRLMKIDPNILSEYKGILAQNYDAVKKYLGLKFEESKKSGSNKNLQQMTMLKLMDMQQSGTFLFSEFIDFCQMIGIPFESTLVKKKTVFLDEREKNGEKLKCGLLEYIIVPERDYFTPGKTTILNSEKAALVIAEKIYQNLGEDEEFYDVDFGPKNQNDKDGSKFSMQLNYFCKQFSYCTGNPPKGYIDPEQISWLRPEEITDETPMFIDDGPAPNDVKQGKIGDCWFIGALSVLATRDELLRGGIGKIEAGPFEADEEMADQFSQGVYPPLFHFYRKKGIYVMRFFKEFQWRYVIIDDRIPCFTYSKKPVFGQCSQLHELWVPLLEKAYAKLHGCYESLISGFIDDALNDMTGLVAEKIQLHNEQKIFPHKSIKDKEEFWKFLIGLARSDQKSMMGCSVVGDVERQIVIDGFNTGIMTGHAYGIIDVFEIKGPIKVHRLLRVRNPWGESEWKGKWGDTSEQIKDNPANVKLLEDQYISKLAEDEKFELGKEDGTFLINYQSWRDLFNNMYICVDFPDSWTGIRFYNQQWDQSCSGGIPSPMTPENMKKWGLNPQYLVESDVDLEIFISLAQPDGRQKRPDGTYLKFPYSDLIHPILFTVCELPAGKNKLDAFDKALVRGASVLKEHREVSLRLKLPAGRYVIVPSTRYQGDYGDYTLSIYFNQPLSEVEIQRLDKEAVFGQIDEETESAYGVEDWKVDLCQQRVKYMILQEDESMNESGLMNTSKLQSGLKLSVALERATQKKSKIKPQENFGYEEAFPDDYGDIE